MTLFVEKQAAMGVEVEVLSPGDGNYFMHVH